MPSVDVADERRQCFAQQLDGVARAHRALDQDRAVDAGHAVVVARDLAQEVRARLGGLGIEGDHLAALVALEHRDHRLLAEPQPAERTI
jgi:hypothetical protein